MSSRLDHPAVAVGALLQLPALAHDHRQADDRVVGRLPVHLGQHHVRLGGGEVAAAGDRRKLRRVAQHQHRRPERKKVAADLLVHHRAFVDDDERRLAGVAVVVQHERRAVLVLAARAIDEAVDRRRADAAAPAHDVRRLAGVGRERHRAARALGDVAGERRLAGAGVAEQAEHLPVGRPSASRPPPSARRPVAGTIASARRQPRSRNLLTIG